MIVNVPVRPEQAVRLDSLGKLVEGARMALQAAERDFVMSCDIVLAGACEPGTVVGIDVDGSSVVVEVPDEA